MGTLNESSSLSFKECSNSLFRRLLATTGGELDESNSNIVFQALERLYYYNQAWSVQTGLLIELLVDYQREIDQFKVMSG